MGKTGILVAGALVAVLGCEDSSGLDLRPPQLEVMPNTIDLGSVYLGGQAEAEVLISNPGQGPLRLDVPVIQGREFSISNVPQILAAGTDTRIAIIYAPTQVGPAQSILRIPTNISDGVAIEVMLTGQGQAPLDCNDNNPCTADTFEANAGTCTYAPIEGECDDGSACTDNDRCVVGECVGRAIQCDDGVECTRDLCDPATGCVTIGDDSKCVDSDPCTLDQCQDSGCENPPAPDGHICGDIVACATAEICVLRQCIEVAIPEGAPCDDKDNCTQNDQCVAQNCTGTPTSRPPIRIVSTTMVEGVSSGTLVGEHLYVATEIIDRQRFKVMGFDEWVAAPIDARPDLAGPANLAQVGADRWARVRTSSVGVRWVELLDTTDSANPILLATAFGGYGAPNTQTTGAVGSMVFFCASRMPTAPPQLTAVDLADPTSIPGPAFLEDRPCNIPGLTVAHQDTWVTWSADADSDTLAVYRLLPGDVSSLAVDTFGGLGGTAGIAIGRDRVIADAGNTSEFVVYDLSQTPPVQHRISLPGQPRLLAAHEQTALFAVRDDIVAYDFQDPAMPQLLPSRVSLDSVLTAADRPVAMDSTRFVLDSADGLKIFALDATGITAPFTVRGTGYFGHISTDPSGLVGTYRAGMTFIDPDRLPPPNLLSTPTSVRLPLDDPHLLDGPNGPIGLFSPMTPRIEKRCPAGFEPVCWHTARVPAGGPLGTVAFATDGTITATPTAAGLTGDIDAAALGCIGAAYDTTQLKPRYVVFDRCRSPGQLQIVSELPARDSFPYQANALRADVQSDGIAALVAQRYAILFDYRQPLAPVIMDEQLLNPQPSAGFLGTAFDGKYWALTWRDGAGQDWLRTIDVEAGGQELHRMALDPAVGRPIGNVIALQWPLLYVGADRDGEALLLVYDLAQATPRLIHTLPLDSPAIDLVTWRDQLYLARADGLTVIEPACAP